MKCSVKCFEYNSETNGRISQSDNIRAPRTVNTRSKQRFIRFMLTRLDTNGYKRNYEHMELVIIYFESHGVSSATICHPGHKAPKNDYF